MPESQSRESFWARVKKSRIAQVLIAYLAVSWGILQVTEILQQAFSLPQWVLPLTVILLAVGLVIIAATAWVQSHPLTAERAARDEVPEAWELQPGEVSQAIARGRLPHLTWARSLLGGVVAFALLFGFAGLYVVIKDRGRSFAPTEAIANDAGVGVAVLPFSVSGGQLEEWREGMVNLLSTNLDGVAGLRAISGRTVLARWDELVGEAGRVDDARSLQVAGATGARYALLGSAVGIGPSVRLTADVHDVETGKTLGRASVEGSPDSVLTLVDRLSIEVIRSIMGGREGAQHAFNLASITTTSVPALKSFLEGEAVYRQANYEAAIAAFERAVQLDSTFALAFYRLSDAYGWKENTNSPLTVQNRQRAVELVDRLPERQALLVRAHAASGTYRAVGLAEEAVRRYPDEPEAWYALGEVRYHQTAQSLASWEEADEAFARAVELDPSFAPYRAHGVDLAFAVADSGLVERRMKGYADLVGENEQVERQRLAAALAYGDSAARAEAIHTLDDLPVLAISQDVATLHPDARWWPVRDEMLAALKRRDEMTWWHRALRAETSLQHGALAEGLARLDEPSVLRGVRTYWSTTWYLEGLPMSAERLESLVSPAAVDTTSNWSLNCGAMYAASEGRWDDHEWMVERLDIRVERFLAAGDSAAARTAAAHSAWARGFGEWKHGRLEAAFDLFEQARRAGISWPEFSGDLLMDMEDYTLAARHYKVNWTNPITRLKLARAYEMLGDDAKARDAYFYFVQAWSDADTELQPMVEQAKESIARLGSDRPR
ncbi:MAG: hypothetical protein PVI01_11010 [Gemmatimonadales bacterium]|jgi:serine/threonine-protein kinase